MKERMRQFMHGRYGQDHLNRFISMSAVAVMVISMFIGRMVLYPLALLLLFLCFFRMLSKNTAKRWQENQVYLRLRENFLRWLAGRRDRFRQRKTHNYYTCPSCHTQLRVPKVRGRISITCPKCHTSFEKKT